MLSDEAVRFPAFNFDKASWRDDAAGVREAAREKGYEAAVERLRSGNGAHLWFFFEEPVATWVLMEATAWRRTTFCRFRLFR